jgi:aspartate aminotransferase-like enzyme
MGHNSRENSVFQVLAALEQVLRGAGVKLTPGCGVAAAEQVYLA